MTSSSQELLGTGGLRRTTAAKRPQAERGRTRTGRPPFPDPSDEVVQIADLQFVDREGYQRKLGLPRVEEMARSWDIVLADYILVARRTDDSLWIIDGQHRVAAATLAGESELLARVFEGMSEEQEADLFYTHSTARRNISSLEKFHAGVAAKYPHLAEIKEIVEESGGRVNRTTNASTGLNIPHTLEKIYQHGGPDILRETLSVTREAFGSLNGVAVEGPMISAIAYVLGIHRETVDRKHLVKRLARAGAEELKSAAKHYEAGNMSRDAARYHAVLDAYNRRFQEKLETIAPDYRKIGAATCARCKRKHYARGLCRPHYDQWYDSQRRRIVDRAPAA